MVCDRYDSAVREMTQDDRLSFLASIQSFLYRSIVVILNSKYQRQSTTGLFLLKPSVALVAAIPLRPERRNRFAPPQPFKQNDRLLRSVA